MFRAGHVKRSNLAARGFVTSTESPPYVMCVAVCLYSVNPLYVCY